MEQPLEITTLPEANEFFVNVSPYTSFEFDTKSRKEAYDVVYTLNTIDCYCPECKSVSVFTPTDNRPVDPYGSKITNPAEWSTLAPNRNTYVERKFVCSRNSKHVMTFNILFKGFSFQKIGQFPSLADINSFEIKKYKKSLGDEYYREFNKAIGLYSHGVGVGSFVYLRRIIENFIVIPAYNLAKEDKDWNDELFHKSRVREKINLLKEHLPTFLIENSIIYSIVSKGIHELSEKECLEYFPVLRSCLEFVLTELEEKRKIDEKKRELALKLSHIAGEI